MTIATNAGARYFTETLALYKTASTTEKTYYPVMRELWARLLEERGLPFEVRAETSERRSGRPGADQPDLALYDKGSSSQFCARSRRRTSRSPRWRLRRIKMIRSDATWHRLVSFCFRTSVRSDCWRQHLRAMIQRIAALLVLHEQADELYEQAAAAAFTAEELGVRT